MKYVVIKVLHFVCVLNQLKWLNDYHKKTAELVGPELKKQNKAKEYDWLMKNTKPITKDVDGGTSAGTSAAKSISLIFVALTSWLSFSNYL